MLSEHGRLPRKLAAILYADVAGYSRLTGEDEDSTHRVLSDYLDLITRSVGEHRGRVMHYAGDAVLAMFEAALDALSCAVKLQRELKARNVSLPETRRVQFRIGVNLGDVIEDRGDIYGDGVNVAARLESLADPGGVCISGMVHEAVFGKLAIEFESLGEKQVKNIARPVHVYRALLHPKANDPAPRPLRIARFAAVAAVLVAVLGLAWWQPWRSDFAAASVERMAFPMPPKPSLALVPLRNLSGDGSDSAFADALSAHLIATLGKLPGVFVIAKDSSFALAERRGPVHEVSERLGIRYVLDGTYRRAGDTLRVSVRLHDALEGRNVWLGEFELRPDNLFTGLGQLAADVATMLRIDLSEEQKAALVRAPTQSAEAWGLHVRARAQKQILSRENNANARALWFQATERDPGFVIGWLSISRTHWSDIWFGWSEDFAASLQQAEASALRGLEIDSDSSGAHQLLGAVRLFHLDYGKALEHGVKATSLAPNDADAFALLAVSQNFAGHPEEAERSVQAAMRLNPYYPPWYLLPQAEAQRLGGRYDEAIRTVREELRRIDSIPARTRLAMYYAHAGSEELARAEISKVLKVKPKMTLAIWSQTQKFRDPAQLKEDAAALRKAGMPANLSWECLVRDKCP